MFDKLSQPDDIFAQTDQSAPQPTPPTVPPIPAATASGGAGSGLQAGKAVGYESTPEPDATAPAFAKASADRKAVGYQSIPVSTSSRASGGGGIKTLVIVVAIIVVIGAAFLISWRILSSRTPVTPEAPGEAGEGQTKEDIGGQGGTKEEVEEDFVEEEPASEPVVDVDTDKDGLMDSRETQLGTNAFSADTDADGLFDREEVEVYLTDPLNADTDGDTYQDGAEVKGGYDPKGPGKLLEIPQGS